MTDSTYPADPIQFQLLFESCPGLYLVLSPTPDFYILAVSEPYLQATMTTREKILGKRLFEIFPDNPDDPNATGTLNLSQSLQRVLKHKAPDVMKTQKYDIRRPESEGGGFEERYWDPLNSPVFKTGTSIVLYIIHSVVDVTEIMKLKIQNDEQAKLTQHLLRANAEMEIFNKAAIGRELKMIELKRRINELSERSGEKPPYDLSMHEIREAQGA